MFNLGSVLALSNIVSLKATLFSSKSENEIRFSPATFTNDNQDDITRRGAELNLNSELTESMNIGLNFTRQDVKFSEGTNKDKNVPLVSEQQMSAVYSWKINSKFTWNSSASYESDKFLDNDQGNTFGQKIPSLTLVNTALRYEASNFETVLSVNNFLDEKYYTYGVASTFTPGSYNAYPLSGRVYSVGMKYKF
jgi:iron complex outermembrane receptor protein